MPGLLVLLDLVLLPLRHLQQQLPASCHAHCQLSVPLGILLSQSRLNHAVPLGCVQLLPGQQRLQVLPAPTDIDIAMVSSFGRIP